jgi:serine/threonine protein kinase
MEITRWERSQSLFHEALKLSTIERQAFLELQCGEDRELHTELLAMLEAHGRGTSILDREPPDIAHQALAAFLESIPDEQFRGYRITDHLDKGGMGVVYRAEREDGNPVAIKVLRDWWVSQERQRRFAIEQKTLGRLEHPHIARFYHADTLAGGTPWFAMEYVDGKHLDVYCEERKSTVDDRLRLFRSVCEAVQHAHNRGIVHRDLKPSNILVTQDGTVKLLDFGIAKQLDDSGEPGTRPELRLMTLPYAAPEQVLGEQVGTYTDIYSLGVVLYELLAGRVPFDLSKCTQREAERIVVEREPEKPSAAARATGRFGEAGKSAWTELDVMCLRAMHKDPAARYGSVGDLIRDVDHYLNSEPLEAQPVSFGYRLSKFVRRNRRAVVAASLAFALLAGQIVFFTVRLAKAREAADRETAITAAMNRFLTDDFLGQTDPFRGAGANESFVDVVNRASPHIDLQFSTEPLVAARLHQTIARAFDNRSDFPQARHEYTRASDLFRQSEGEVSANAIIARLQRAAMEARSIEPGSLAIAKRLSKEAEMSISGIVRPREDLEVWLLSTRGIIAITENDGRSANEDFSAALRRAQTIPAFDEAARRRIKRTLAFSYIRLGDGAKAEPLFREIAEDYSKSGGPDNPYVLQARVNLSQALLIQRKYREAIDIANVIYPVLVKKLGEDHETTLTVLGARAASEGSLGLWDDAIRDDLTVYGLAVRKRGPVSFPSISTLSDAGLSQCHAGRYKEGESNARKAFQESRQAFGPRAGLTGGCSYALATCLIGMNKQLDEASGLLRDIDVKAVTQLSGDSAVAASIALAQGQIAALRGDYAQAQRQVRTAAPMIDRPDSDMSDRRALATLKSEIESHLRASR